MGEWKRIRSGAAAAVLALCFAVQPWPVSGLIPAFAETRTEITDVHLNIDSTIESGNSSGFVYVTTGDEGYRAGSAEILNDDNDWIGGMIPRVQVELYAESGYYFAGTGRSMFHFSGDDASYVTARREDDKTTLVLTFKLDKLENGDLTVTGARWDEGNGTAEWDENPNARYYQVRLYRNDSSVTGTRTTQEDYYEFAGSITRKGDYYFEVRAVGGGSEKGDWESSDAWYVSSAEADEISDGYDDGPGDWNSWGSNGGPGVTGGGYGPGGGPGSSGGPGVTGGSHGPGSGICSGSGGNWCLDQYGWWFRYPDGSWPHNDWQCIDGTWYCFNNSGYIRYGWINWENQWYYCDSNGSMLVNTRTPDGYYVGGNGVWIP